MHIAICDDNMADRHQMERLLKRESDQRRDTSNPLYIDSYGNCAALLTHPMLYNLFYIDVCRTEGITGMDVVDKLTAAGVKAPIIMCCSDINYREHFFPENVKFLDKPIKAAELHKSIEYAQQHSDSAESLIELRDEKETLYVTEADILYAVEKGGITTITLMDGRTIHINTTAMNFFSQVETYPSFSDVTWKCVLNCRYIQKISFGRAAMTDGATFKIDHTALPYTKEMFNKYHSS